MGASKSSSSGLTSTDIVDIIKACNDSRVSKLSIGDLSIEFDLHRPLVENIDKVYRVHETSSPELDAVEGDKVDLVEAVLDSEDILEQLKLTDPYQWERLVMKDEIDDGR